MAVNFEARVISSLINNQDMVVVLGQPLDAMMVTCGDVWEFIKDYHTKNREVPPASVVMDMFPDFEFQPDLEGATKHHIENLKKISVKNQTEFLLEKSSQDLASGKFSPTKIVEHLQKRLSNIQREMGNSRSVDLRDVDNAVGYYERVAELAALHGGQPGIPFGFEPMDEAYPTGRAPGDLGIIMGYSGHMKSWFALKLALNSWLRGYSVMFINLEMSPEQLRDRLFFLISQYTMKDFARGSIDVTNFRAWAQDFMEGRPDFNIIGNDNFGDFSVDMVHAKIEQFKPDEVFLDYLSLFTDRECNTEESRRMKNLSRQLKQLATAQEIPITAIAAVTGKDKKDRLNPPEIAQVAWSSGIEYDANWCVAVHSHRNPKTQVVEKTEVVARKNRNGSLFSFYIKMDMETGVVTEIDEKEQIEMLLGDEEGVDDEFAFLDKEKESV